MVMPSRPLVWVLERDSAVAASLIFALRLEGFDVEVQSGPEALGRAGRAHPDCLLVDADYPAVSPVGLLSRIRAKGYAGPAIFTATNPKRHLHAEIRASGAMLLEKPWTGDGLVSEICALLKRERSVDDAKAV
ncbi:MULTISPECIES: response regulator [Caulobacter]|uniref:Response regulatory domain-containing protein n=2 Tax=Caulobacter TaxID=75 RepID=A0A2T9J7K9_9CAUL|nr:MULTISPECIES: response regulator [Caulobacter]MBI1684258.1 response regulator [Caulobacter hibisci]PVM77520.1 hypothetical protein DDF65_16480 [Caulobacter radicis]